MKEKTIYLSNDPIKRNEAIENAMIRIAEEMKIQIQIENFANLSRNSSDGSMIVLCPDINVEDVSVLDSIASRYYNNQPVILYKPTNREINTVYRYIEGRNYFCAESTTSGYTLFGLKYGKDGISYILENHEKSPEQIAESLVAFLKDEQEKENEIRKRGVIETSEKVLGENGQETVNLAKIARSYVMTKQFSLADKQLSLSYYMVSCHVYDGESPIGGEDWFFIQQHGILNGAGGYNKYWAGTRVRVNDESWYVGQGEVALNYVDYYRMVNKIALPTDSNEESENDINLLYAEPQAINGVTAYTISESQSIAGTVGFEAGVDGGSPAIKGNGSISAGAGFESSYTFEVQDCSCMGESLNNGTASAGWKYSFKRAKQNREAGKWQRLHDPALLSVSAFSPVNTWIWKFPTEKRDSYKQFNSMLEVGIMNTISRYSGSQSPKDIRGNSSASKSFLVTLHMPPLLGVDQRELLFSKESCTKTIKVASQGKWKLIDESSNTWVHISNSEGSGKCTNVYITVDELKEGKERSTVLMLTRFLDLEMNIESESLEIQVFQSPGSVNMDLDSVTCEN